jgi:hypothetical protein
MASLYGAAITRNVPEYLSNLTPLVLMPDRPARTTSAVTGADTPEATATTLPPLGNEASPDAEQDGADLPGAVGPDGDWRRWRVSLNPRFEPLLGLSRGFTATPGRSGGSSGIRGGTIVQTINIMPGQGGLAELAQNAEQVRDLQNIMSGQCGLAELIAFIHLQTCSAFDEKMLGRSVPSCC